MIDMEKVIKGLELLHDRLLDAAKRDAIVMLDASMVADAIAMLKEQEPRVLTADELYLMEHKCVYLERRNSQLYLTEPSIVIGTSKPLALCQYEYILMRENKISDVRYSNDYNKETKSGWRCWSAKPTEERRKEVKWE